MPYMRKLNVTKDLIHVQHIICDVTQYTLL